MPRTIESIDRSIELMGPELLRRRDVINVQAVWLFLALLGCWSVSPAWLRLLALCLSVAFFWKQVRSTISESGSTIEKLSDLEEALRLLAVEPVALKSRLYDIEQLRKMLSSIAAVRHGWPFMACWLFLMITAYFSVLELVKRGA